MRTTLHENQGLLQNYLGTLPQVETPRRTRDLPQGTWASPEGHSWAPHALRLDPLRGCTLPPLLLLTPLLPSLPVVRRQQDGSFFKAPPYPGYPFLMLPELGSPYLANGALSPGGARTVSVPPDPP